MPSKPTPPLHERLPIPPQLIERRIHLIRGLKVMLDSDLADLYGVATGNLNLAVRRNRNRFPEDFMFQLTVEEHDSLLLQFARAKGRGGRRTPPYAFTQEGVSMLSSVLNSDRAVQVNIAIMRAFVKLREVMASHKDLAHEIEALERRYQDHDEEIQIIFQAIKKFLEPPANPKRRIGFRTSDDR